MLDIFLQSHFRNVCKARRTHSKALAILSHSNIIIEWYIFLFSFWPTKFMLLSNNIRTPSHLRSGSSSNLKHVICVCRTVHENQTVRTKSIRSTQYGNCRPSGCRGHSWGARYKPLRMSGYRSCSRIPSISGPYSVLCVLLCCSLSKLWSKHISWIGNRVSAR